MSDPVLRLERAARRLGRRAAVASPLPHLFLFTDPERTPEPEAIVERLPAGSGVVFRAFGALDALERGRRLRWIADAQRLLLLVGADAELARAIGADGVHLPERDLHRAAQIRRRRPHWRLTGAAHDAPALHLAAAMELDAAFVSPVFASGSPSAGRPLGATRLARWAETTAIPLYALGGIDERTARQLRGCAGLAAVAALAA